MSELYEEIPPYPETFTPGTVLGRLMDGIGFRYRWATEGLTDRDLEYRPDASSRSISETLSHIHGLISFMSENGLTGARYTTPEAAETPSFEELRRVTLEQVKHVSDQLKATPNEKFEAGMPLRFTMEGKDHEFPFWNAINGTMADALYHVGQVVSHRRAAGNPIDSHVNVFLGTRSGF